MPAFIPQYLIDREQVRRNGLRAFVRRAWPQVEPRDLVWGWHLDAVAEHLDAVRKREIRDLVINQPPGTSKSLVASVLWPAHVWTCDPGHRWICVSFDQDLVLRDARRCRTLLEGTWYRDRWPEVEIPSDRSASTAVGIYNTSRGGLRYSTTIRGGVTGHHCDTMLVDDPIDPKGAALLSGAEIEEVLAWWHDTAPTRFVDQRTAARVLVMQRLHEKDLSDEMARMGATVLCLPMRFEEAHPHSWIRDPRKEGELLEPTRFPEEAVARLEAILGPSQSDGQLQQRPGRAGGAVFRQEWLQHYWVELPAGGIWTLSIDAAFKDKASGSKVAIHGWYQQGPNFYLVERDTRHMTFTETCAGIKAMAGRCPKAQKKLLEDKANGPAVEDALKRELPGIEMVTPEGGKESRAHAVSPLFASGNVLLPHPERAVYPDGRRGAPWVHGPVAPDRPAARGSYEHVMVSFPTGEEDDDVDATTQYLNRAAGSFASRFIAAMQSVKKEQGI